MISFLISSKWPRTWRIAATSSPCRLDSPARCTDHRCHMFRGTFEQPWRVRTRLASRIAPISLLLNSYQHRVVRLQAGRVFIDIDMARSACPGTRHWCTTKCGMNESSASVRIRSVCRMASPRRCGSSIATSDTPCGTIRMTSSALAKICTPLADFRCVSLTRCASGRRL